MEPALILDVVLNSCSIITSSLSQAAADYVKAHLPETLKQQLQSFEREKRESALSYASILEQRILTVDREMLDKLSANHDEAGQEGEESGGKWIHIVLCKSLGPVWQNV